MLDPSQRYATNMEGLYFTETLGPISGKIQYQISGRQIHRFILSSVILFNTVALFHVFWGCKQNECK
jgi:hypothetical protein